ncbi:hypothetical protein E1262_15705 [Jiangella aurantiaca]|uniref:Hen1 N-terminal domain-containing protein n=1 Tax=Jiangella aurantiaca TaxID=2530373 RepID=A0A4V2YS80_9ACTN|nr:hypothetical protein E1262_15705 [Jiangella aurantiaca]
MLLTLTSAVAYASDLRYLLHKHPERVQSFQLSVGVVGPGLRLGGSPPCTATPSPTRRWASPTPSPARRPSSRPSRSETPA